MTTLLRDDVNKMMLRNLFFRFSDVSERHLFFCAESGNIFSLWPFIVDDYNVEF